MRGQSEVISTAIIVSVAIVLALGLVYYLSPYIARSQGHYQLYSLLSSYSASLEISPIAIFNSSNSASAVLLISNMGSYGFRLYISVIALYHNIPVDISLNTSIYNMTGNYSVLSPSGIEGWAALNGTSILSSKIYLYVTSSYYKLSDISKITSINIVDLGVLGPRDLRVIKTVIQNISPAYSYAVFLFARIDNKYYEIGRYVIYSG